MVARRADRAAVDHYWQGIKDRRPLSRDEEAELFRRARAGEKEACDALILANLRFVVRVAHGYTDRGLSLIELISEGNVGLLEAIKRFDDTRGFKFITYAVWWIRQAILKALANHGKAAPPPMSQINDLIKVEKEAGALTQRLGRTPTHYEIAVHAGISPERVQTAIDAGRRALSLEAPLRDGEDSGTLASVLACEDESVEERLERDQLGAALGECLNLLERREYQIIRRYFGLDGQEPETMEAIAQVMGITRERVRQLRNRALRKIRHHGGEYLAEFSTN